VCLCVHPHAYPAHQSQTHHWERYSQNPLKKEKDIYNRDINKGNLSGKNQNPSPDNRFVSSFYQNNMWHLGIKKEIKKKKVEKEKKEIKKS
jgi:hypothetical protein